MDVKRYLEEGKGLEEYATFGPWGVVEGDYRHSAISPKVECYSIDAPCEQEGIQIVCVSPSNDPQDKYTFSFIADARQRLPKYRKALEAILEILDKPWEDSADYYCLRCRETEAAIKTALQ